MKRTLAFLAVILAFCLAPLSGEAIDPLQDAVPDYKPLAFDETPGAYAIYRDTRGGGDSFVGLCYLGGNEIAVRLFEPMTGSELLYTQTWYSAGEEAEGGTVNPVSGTFDSSPAAARVTSMVAAWAGAWFHSRLRFEEEPDFTFDEGFKYDFRYWVPVFRMFSSEAEGDGPKDEAGSVRLVTAGIAQTSTDPAFFEYKKAPSVKPSLSGEISCGAQRTVTVEGLTVPLDTNWKEGGDGIWRIARFGPQDAAFLVETLNIADFGNRDVFDLIKMLVLNSGWQLLPDDLRIFVSNECPCVFYRVYDPDTGTVTVQYKMFVTRNEKDFSMVSLSVDESVYATNRAYFDAILF